MGEILLVNPLCDEASPIYTKQEPEKKRYLVGLCFCTDQCPLLCFMIRLFHAQQGMVSLSILHYTIPKGLSKCTLRCGHIVCTLVAPLSSLAQQGMVRLCLPVLPLCVQNCCWKCLTWLPKVSNKSLALHAKCLKRSLALHKTCLNKSVALYPKCLNKVFLCTTNIWTKILLCIHNGWTKVLLCIYNGWTKVLFCILNVWEKSSLGSNIFEQKSCF